MRAFLHGRLDLTQAEAVNDIISATTLYQAQVAARQCSGALSQQLKPLKEVLVDIIVNLESAVEFVEENLPTASRETIVQQLEHCAAADSGTGSPPIDRAESSRKASAWPLWVGRMSGKAVYSMRCWLKTARLLPKCPGRRGIWFRNLRIWREFLSGCWIRQEFINRRIHIEKLGIDRSLQAIADADAILLVVDRSKPQSHQDAALRQQLAQSSCVVVMNKSDLPSAWSSEEKRDFAGSWPLVEVSAKTGSGIEELRTAILKGLLGMDGMRAGHDVDHESASCAYAGGCGKRSGTCGKFSCRRGFRRNSHWWICIAD